MRFKSVLLILSLLFIGNQNLFADSPLTSTFISNAYKDIAIVRLAEESKGSLNIQLMNYLVEDGNPIDVKISLINALGYDINGKNNSAIFLKYLQQKKGYRDINDFFERANSIELICMAYILALDDYFDVEDALTLAKKAVSKNSNSYTFNIIYALIEAQYVFDDDWCKVYTLTNNVRLNRQLKIDMRENAINIVFEYMDLYEDDCYGISKEEERVRLNFNNKNIYSEEYEPTNYVFLNSKKLIAGETTNINSEKAWSIYDLTTSVTLAKDGEKTLIFFWQETSNESMNFFNWLWEGNVILYLENGEIVTLIDRNIKGQNILEGEYKDMFGVTGNLYQRFSVYYLTNSECEKLKKSNLSRIAYKTNEVFESGTTYLKVNLNKDTLKRQLLAIGS